ncbi:Elongation factor Tu GTP binding domain containing protein [Aphelenchoides avenae]|nr:Elongation factor Tu GTP binding domain containing protein [Aphelenchus avenae]
MCSTVAQLPKVFQRTPSQVRNVCIVAHVDHGKTSLADCLISASGTISVRMAGKLRYMDNREDEQTRGITMKSSAFSLYFEPLLLNLIDSPGHMDFSSEVTSAVNIADVAVLVVDVVEGVCPQTENLLRQAVYNHLDIVLVLNKIDRLIVELKMSEADAFRHIRQLFEQLNSCYAQILQMQLVEEEWQKVEEREKSLHFDPTHRNVIFASAIHAFGFSLEDFAAVWSQKLKIAQAELLEAMFSDHYFASGRIQPDAEAKGKKTLFEQLVLQPLWDVHKCALIDKDADRLKELASKLSLPPLKSRRVDEAFDEFMRNWLPLTSAVVKACAKASSPETAFSRDERLNVILDSDENHPLREHIRQCDPTSDFATVVVSKLFKHEEKRIALCRILSGTVRTGQELHVAGSKEEDAGRVIIKRLYIMLGRELVPIERAPAGTVFGMETEDWLTGSTLCSQRCDKPVHFDTSSIEPLVRVTIHSLGGPEEWDELKAALKQLAMLDSAVRLFQQENGDLALVTAGEVHLQKCLQDLNDLGQTNIVVSEPIVPFLETVIPDSQSSYAKIVATQLTECTMKQHGVHFKLRAVPIPDEIVEFLQKNETILAHLREGM